MSDVLIVGGDVNYSGGSVKNGNVVYGGTAIALPSIPNGTARQEANPLSSSTAAWVNSVSTVWASQCLPSNPSCNVSLAGTTLTFNGTDPMRNVFKVSGADLATAKTLKISAPAGSIVIINIDGIADKLVASTISLSGTDSLRVVFNFYQATSLAVNSGTVPGTIWAPLAAVTVSGGPINGSLLAKSLQATSVSFNGPSFVGPLP
jgi:choice-of-anchor A domain-containing protein